MTPSSLSALTRRDAVKLVAAASAALMVGASHVAAQATAAASRSSGGLPSEVPALPYAHDALEPHIDAETMRIHHGKHHASYLTAARKLLEDHKNLQSMRPEELIADLSRAPESIRTGLRNQLGGHVNHAFFWEIMAPARSYQPGPLQQSIGETFGSVDKFKAEFKQAALGRFGSGWAWLSREAGGKLRIHSTANQDSPLMEKLTPIIGLDVWEHAYYLKQQNKRGDYVDAFWNVLNWDRAEQHFRAART